MERLEGLKENVQVDGVEEMGIEMSGYWLNRAASVDLMSWK